MVRIERLSGWFSVNNLRIMRGVKRIVKRVALLIGGLALLYAAVWFIGLRWGFTPLPKLPRGVRIEPLFPPLARKDLKPDNAAFLYLKADDLLTNYTPFKSHLKSEESMGQMEALLAGETSGDTKAIEHTLADCREALDLGREASDMSFCQMPLMTWDLTFPHRALQLARLLVADGKLAQRNGDSGRAITNYLAAVKLGTDCSKGGAILQSLVGTAIIDMGSQAIRAWILQTATTREATAGILESLSRDDHERTPYTETLRNELKFAKGEVRHQILEEAGPWGRTLYSKRVTDCYLDAAFGDLIQESDTSFWQSDAKSVVERWLPEGRQPFLSPLNRPMQRVLIEILFPAIEGTRRRVTRAELDLTATEIVCAMKTYEIANGKPPEQLIGLVPKFLPTIPIDPFDGKPLRYRSDGTNWVIWSVGSDLKDDDAAWHEFKYLGIEEERKGGDIFFKSTERQDDLTYYLTHKDFRGRRGRVLPSNTPVAVSKSPDRK